MFLPEHFTIEVSPFKLSGYLLNRFHPEGWSKAKYFHEHGITDEKVLKDLLLSIVNTNEVAFTIENQFGTKYIVEGRNKLFDISLRTVWVVLTGENICKFVTACPL